MGRKIDRIVLTSAAALFLHILFMGAFNSIPISLFMTFIAMICLKKLSGLIPSEKFGRKRRARENARKILEEIALTDVSQAHERLSEILTKAFPADSGKYSLDLVLRHPTGSPLTPDDILARWKARRSCARLIIASPAKAGKEALLLTEKLASPKVLVLDGPALIPIIMKTAPVPEKSVPKRVTIKQRVSALHAAAARAKPIKCLRASALLTLVFFISGSPTYLAAAIILAFIAAVALKPRKTPKSLFQ